ncbi:FMN-binding negative transcriptional regulator [Pontivivens insulae]|uniref:Protease synthase and sporulation protein PAI 2 n=1 Tax=Pontivivens insulae TaxID=1639689 RepID=A0A2R8AAL2_9RHOB|nr:FMN-binding negative transcriptional regulator [Pontivivens insulae]RED13185.1 PaiB family negative transcriptional regulator [Pontivivens insulae]SPF29277.1 Protease synthase and sporulation protein PAI 2 [Pontivivens insulae]
MHPNPNFRHVSRARNLTFARERGFGTLSVAVEGEVVSSHIPFRVDESGTWVEMHLARSNPILRHPSRAVLMVTGPDAYISPDWYGVVDQVPTWNYVAVHLRGALSVLPATALRPHLERVSEHFEATLDKPAWTLGKMTPDVLTRMERMIVPVRLEIEDVQGTWKLGQNKDDDVRHAAAAAVGGSHGMEQVELGALMSSPPPQERI